MAKYKSIARWRDLEDGHLYNPGEAYPHDGRQVSGERVADLTGTQNKAGFALIQAIAVPNDEKPVETDEVPKKATRSRKKTT